ncbi:MAG: nicotinate (nicotinamide) nucleotide adenylyltransferase [Candidatus Pacebacteria bacterium RIFOXYB1_FULL_39_46]|nr:MAG: nicotinate (nicotinamide) nucleotide adenylyltransferase [Candidatus Pacebacteria bacterium RIFOXYA1_FULL_38_18]OGJ38446.1 MAG: nicotinate (nicotinamide) nucleotide adenylyltransferase [Candidatus Pacebacteria bacterium RIFOXYB1_FULL_39_46]OGJ40306.1 MAG: nicotinate (nicotinamide) nucleotide adenylyltransferase [Candidatus Pacebacteria bacterium RIFOXYC1_FULL_39_21]OGJ40879.1 MAG: nicotinate (nicotinamide) nucleotide adenylyltransferase [Candidatus Pacebacteria bacterium RIFOXYD1_FULL_39
MKIVLFGGAFDPPHLGHQHITQILLNQQIADEVWYVPTKEHPFSKSMSPVVHRLAMLKLIINNPRIKIEKYELEKGGISYSRDTLDYLSNKYPQHSFAWIIGSDNLPDFHKWGDSQGRDYQDLLDHYRFYVYPRKNFALKPLYKNMIPLEQMKEIEVSSTVVRQNVKQSQPITKLVDPLVKEYIHTHHLYVE